MVEFKIFDKDHPLSASQKTAVIDFLHTQLEEYGDSKADIEKAIDYSLQNYTSFGGFVTLLEEDNILKAAVVVNQTGMGGYIPENILVYIATHRDHRGQGLGRKVMEEVIQHAKGDIALHVEAGNPARFLYEKLGFTNPYLEMRLKKG